MSVAPVGRELVLGRTGGGVADGRDDGGGEGEDEFGGTGSGFGVGCREVEGGDGAADGVAEGRGESGEVGVHGREVARGGAVG